MCRSQWKLIWKMEKKMNHSGFLCTSFGLLISGWNSGPQNGPTLSSKRGPHICLLNLGLFGTQALGLLGRYWGVQVEGTGVLMALFARATAYNMVGQKLKKHHTADTSFVTKSQAPLYTFPSG